MYKVSNEKYDVIAFDFETTTLRKEDYEDYEKYREDIKNSEPVVYSWATAKRKQNNSKEYSKDNYEIKDGLDISSFVDEVLKYKKKTIMYAANGSKFDSQFILVELEKRGFKNVINIKENNIVGISEFKHEDIETEENLKSGGRKLKYGEFRMTTNGNHQIMQLDIALKSKNGRGKHRLLTIRDITLMFPSSLAGYGIALNKQYGTDKFSKMDLEGGYTRTEQYKSYEEFINDGNEQEYLHQDVIILSEFIHMMSEALPHPKWRMTAAGTAYKIWVDDFIGEKLIEEKLESGYINAIAKEGYVGYRIKGSKKVLTISATKRKLLNSKFPVKFLEEDFEGNLTTGELIRKSFSGGLTMANPDHAGKKVENVAYCDVSSHYPNIMLNMYLPFGKRMIYEEGYDPKKHLGIFKLKIKKVKNYTGMPFLPDLNEENKGGKSYNKKLKNQTHIITSTELERFEKYYFGDYEVEYQCHFFKQKGHKIFGEYITFYYNLKAEADRTGNIALKLYAKLMLNSLYGKFAEKPIRETKIYVGGKKQWRTVITKEAHKFYLPLATFITAHARMYLVDAIGDKYELCNYEDTDSVSIIVDKSIDITNREELVRWLEQNFKMEFNHPDFPAEIGNWDIEKTLNWQICRRAKQYLFETTDGKKDITFAGLRLKPEQIEELTEEEFVMGKTGLQQLRPFRLPTGIILEEYEKQIKPIWDYDLNPSYWFQTEEEYRKYYDRTRKTKRKK